MRTIAVAEANNSRQPTLPHLHFNPENGSTVVCPISPAEPCAPRHNSPSRITPPPTPVPNVTLITSRQPRAAPSHISPTAAALAAFSTNTDAATSGGPSLLRHLPAAFTSASTKQPGELLFGVGCFDCSWTFPELSISAIRRYVPPRSTAKTNP